MAKLLLLTLLAFAATTLAFCKDAAVQTEMEACAKENNFNFADLKAGDDKVLEKMEFKCTIKCLMTKMEAFTDDGEANIAKIIEKFPVDEDELKAAVEKCKGLHNEENLCEKIGGRGICIGKELKETMSLE